MFHIRNVERIAKYLLLSAMTLSTGCLAAARDDNIYYFTTRRPFWNHFTVPTYTPLNGDESSPGENDSTIFIIVLIVGVLVIALLSYFCQQSRNSTTNVSLSGIRGRVAGAVIHPPPRNHGTLTTPTAPELRGSTNNPMRVSFVNTGYQSDQSVTDGGRPGDVPPDYAAVALGDLTTLGGSNFPTVVRIETPPPKYQDGQPFP